MTEIIEIDGEFIMAGRTAYREGGKACEEGKPKSDNPYEEGSYCALQWRKGFANTFYWSQLK